MAWQKGQSGNPDGRPKGKPWADAIRRALARREQTGGAGLNQLADKLIDAAVEGDMVAMREVADRLDGKPMQSIDAEFRGSLTSVIEALPMHNLRQIEDKPEPDLLPAPGNGQ